VCATQRDGEQKVDLARWQIFTFSKVKFMGNKNAPLAKNMEHVETMPLAEEQAEIATHRKVDSRVQLTRSTHEVEKLLQAELTHEHVEIKHVAKNCPVADDYSAEVRQEGDVFIIPVIEEQVEIVRRKVLKEEIHIHKHINKEEFQQSVTLRNQEVKITKKKL